MTDIDALLDLALDPCPDWQPRSDSMRAVKDMLADGRWHESQVIFRRVGSLDEIAGRELRRLEKAGLVERRVEHESRCRIDRSRRVIYWRLCL